MVSRNFRRVSAIFQQRTGGLSAETGDFSETRR